MQYPRGDKLSAARGQTAVLAGVVLSAGLHAGGLVWWLSQPVPSPLELGVEQTVTVDLIALAPPAGEQLQQPVAEPPPVAQSEPEPLRQDDMAEQHRVIKKPLEKKPAPKKTIPQPPVNSAPAQSPAVASAASPAATAPAPAPLTAARYDAAYLKNPAPAYPPLSRRLGEEGRVLLRVQVSIEGQALAVEVKKSSGFARLDEAAAKAAVKWRFVPARQGETAVASWVEVPIQFSLQK